MYVPYLYALTGELLAIRDLAQAPPSGPFLPVVEPVDANPAKLIRAAAACQDAGLPISIVTNPTLRDFEVPGALAPWLAGIRASLDLDVVRPALLIGPNVTASEVDRFVSEFPTGALLAVIRSGALPAARLAQSFVGRDVLVVVHHNVDDSTYVSAFGHSRVIRLTDSFVGRERNADYAGSEWFTSGHTTFAAAGRPGFGDYTVLLSSPPRTGGGGPGAVVIHASTIDPSGDIWVRHYVSDETDRNEGSPGEKLMEAMVKLRADRALFLHSPGMLQFDAQFNSNSPTSLATNKRQQISHHIFTAASALA